MPAKDPTPESLSFEQALERLESIVERIEGGKLGLEASIGEYEQGVALIKRCKEILARQEQRVEELNKQAAGLGQDGDE
ncbi:MAG: exodeoxyribonuclease VII small subunit [Planctomycetes bacterium]|nr:exodeoxyribonuclease VII small subunit [Planctomycetota bacterium]